jgi:hypothetical protein
MIYARSLLQIALALPFFNPKIGISNTIPPQILTYNTVSEINIIKNHRNINSYKI